MSLLNYYLHCEKVSHVFCNGVRLYPNYTIIQIVLLAAFKNNTLVQ